MGLLKKSTRAHGHQPDPNVSTESLPEYTGPAILPLLPDDPDQAKANINYPSISLCSTKDAVDFLCRFPLHKYIGIHDSKARSFCCIFHEDTSPSANVHVADTTGHFLLTCRGECKQTWDIFGATMKYHKISFQQALTSLMYIFNITVDHPFLDTTSYTPQLESNLRILQDLVDTNPDLHKLLQKNYSSLSPLDIMKHLLQTGIRLHTDRQDIRDSHGYPIFFQSVREMRRQMEGLVFGDNASSGVISAKISLLSYLGLVERVPFSELSKEAAEIAKSPEHDYRKKDIERFKRSYSNPVCFYRIPAYTPDHVEHIKQQVERWKLLRYTIKGLTYQAICDKEGKEVANRIYGGRHIRKPKSK